MAHVKLYNKTGDEAAIRTQTALEKNFGGHLPEVFQAMGRTGAFLGDMLRLSESAGKGLDPKTKELIAIAVSAVNGCDYCVSAHRASALKAGVTDEEITAAIEVAAQMSAFNAFNKAIGLTVDIKA